ncbi:MAG: hypothetical protein WKG00_36355 [Polyangiaceae bacterium]
MSPKRWLPVVLAGAALLPGSAGADLGAVHPEVAEATREARAATGPEGYAAMRELWRTWDRADPAQVEAALESVRDSAATPSLRVYADLLAAYARRRRGDLDGALARVADLGFIGRWMTLGPFDNDNKDGFERAFGPEDEQNEPVAPHRSYDGKERPVRWRVPPTTGSYGWFDLGEVMRPREKICGYATTFVRAKAGSQAPRPVTLWVGSAGAFKVLYNGELVLEDAAYRDLDIDRFATTVTLRPGDNRITVKVCGDEDAPKLALRIGDAQGAPDRAIEVRADVGEEGAKPPASPGTDPKPGAQAPAKPAPASKPDTASKPAAKPRRSPVRPSRARRRSLPSPRRPETARWPGPRCDRRATCSVRCRCSSGPWPVPGRRRRRSRPTRATWR